MASKRYLGMSVYQAAKERIAWAFDTFNKIYVSFSGGKDSTVMLHIAMDEAIKRDRKVGVLFVDLEGQYKLTIDHIKLCYDIYSKYIDKYWIALPIKLRNAVSMYEPNWICWQPDRQEDWIRPLHKDSISDLDHFDFYTYPMEFEEFVPEFGHWYAQGELCACLVGIRSAESLNRWRTIAGHGTKFDGINWTNWTGRTTWNIYPIYDWKTQDIWTYHAKFDKPYNKLYDLMYKAGLSIHQARICQPYGDDQRKGLWLFQIIEPETWARVVARVNGANQGALYANESGNILGRIKIDKPKGYTWEQFALMLLDSMPLSLSEHYKNKIAVFIYWWKQRGYPNGIPDEEVAKLEANKKVPSWKRVCKSLLRNDYWCKGLSFSQTKSTAYSRYKKLMARRRAAWGIMD